MFRIERTLAAREAALNYFWSVKQTSGSHVFWTDDYPVGWIIWKESMSAVIVQAAAQFIKDVQEKGAATPVQQQLINNYLSIFPNVAQLMLDGVNDNNNETLIHVFRLIALAEMRPFISNTSLQISIGTNLLKINDLLRARQLVDGGWNRYGTGNVSDPLTSAWVGMALDHLKPALTDPVVIKNISYLLKVQNPDGTWYTNSGLFTYQTSISMGTTSLVMAYLPVALEHLGNPDVSVRHIFYNVIDEKTVRLSASVFNRGLSEVNVPTLVKFYNGSPTTGALLGSTTLDKLASGKQVEASISANRSAVTEDVFVVIEATPDTPECLISNNQARAALITVRTTDLGGLFDTQTYLLNVDDVNEAPVITSDPILKLEGGQRYNYQVTVTDNDVGDAHFFSIQSGPAGLYIDPRTGRFSSDPRILRAGQHTVVVLVQDLRGLTDTQTFILEVTENFAPKFITSPVFKGVQSTGYRYDAAASDLNPGDKLSYFLKQSPIGMNYDANTGKISWISSSIFIESFIEPLLTNDKLCYRKAESAVTVNAFADVVIAMDESGSMGGEQAWVSQAVTSLDASLLGKGIGQQSTNLYGMVGFSTSSKPRVLLNGEKFVSSSSFPDLAKQLTLSGDVEDGWRAIDVALTDYTLRENSLRTVILITDEDRNNTDNTVTYQSLLTKLKANNALLNAIVNATFYCKDGTQALGMDANKTGYVADGKGGFFTCNDAYALNGFGQTVSQYVDLALESGGVAWDINFLRQSGTYAASFTKAFVAIKTADIVKTLPPQNQVDLVAHSIAYNQAQKQLSAVITNRGLADLTENTQIIFTHESSRLNATLGSVNINSLAAGQSTVVALNILDDASISQTVRVDIIASKTLNECHTNNNTTRAAVVDYQVFDQAGLYDEQKFTIALANSNDAPAITSDSSSTATFGQDYSFQVTAHDVDAGDSFTYALTDAPEGFSIDEHTGLISAKADVLSKLKDGYTTFSITVTDLGGASSTQDHLLTVSPADNLPPSFPLAPTLKIAAGEILKYQLQATDPEGDAITYLISQAPAGMVIHVSGLIEWVSAYPKDIGTYSIKVTAVDSKGASASQFIAIEVADPFILNNAPVITSVPEGAVYAGKNYSYQVVATDADHDNLTYRLENAAAGMSISADGVFNWLPAQSQVGQSFRVDIIVEDGRGGKTAQSLTLPVNENANNPPAITSTPGVAAVVDKKYTYAIQVTDLDGDAVSLSLDEAPNGMVLNNNTLDWTPSSKQVGQVHTVIIRATDSRGAMATQTFGIAVNQANSNNTAPKILSIPTSPAQVGINYSYQMQVVDAENDKLTYSLDTNAPQGMVLDQNGLLSWTPSEAQVGDYNLMLTVSDGQSYATQSFTLTAVLSNTDNHIPSIISLPKTEATVQYPYQYQVLAKDADNDALTYGLLTAPTGMTIDNKTGLISWTPGSTQAGSHEIQVSAEDGKGGKALQTYEMVVFAQPQPIKVSIYLSSDNIAAGEPLEITVVTSGGVGDISTQLQVDGQTVPINNYGQANITASSVPGEHLIEVKVSDANGTVSQTKSYYVLDSTDTSPPVVVLKSPTQDSVITAPVDVIASVSDANLVDYTLYISPKDQKQWQVVLTGNSNVNGSIGRFDPSQLMNGQYDLLLQATDTNGQKAADNFSVIVEGELKVGNFSIAFKDQEIPIGNLPISITRTYDSRQRAQGLDFGQGWSINYQDVRVQESRPAGYQWKVVTEADPGSWYVLDNYCVISDGDNLVTIALPGGKVEKFKAKAYPECALMQSVRQVSIIFEALDGTYSTLEPIGGSNDYRVVDGHLVDLSDPYTPVNFNKYRLTTAEGFVYLLDQGLGIEKIIEPQGETLTFNNNGIIHSLGKSVKFTRDSSGRITKITAPDNTTTQYGYDANGDLRTMTDAKGNLTRFTYHAQMPHYLEEIHDPLGNRAVKNEYNQEGRLVAQIDAENNRIEFTHNIDGRLEYVKDGNGKTLIYAYDERGNVLTEINGASETTTHTYDQYGNELTRTDALNHTTAWEYDSRGRQVVETDALNNKTRTEYDNYNAVLSVTGPDNTVSVKNVYQRENSYGKPINGPLVKMTNALNQETTFRYSSNFDGSFGPLISIRDSAGNVTSYQNSYGYKVEEVAPNGKKTRYTYDAKGRVLTETIFPDANDQTKTLTTSHEYDANGNLVKTTDPQGRVTQTEYDANNKVIAEIDVLRQRTEHEYNAKGQEVLIRYPDQSTEAFEYDGNGNQVKHTDRANRSTFMEYDGANRLVKTIYPDNTTTRTEYDAAGRTIAQIDARNQVTKYEYDAAGRQILVRDALKNETRTEYDNKGQRIASLDAKNRRTQYEYDLTGKQLAVVYPDNTRTTTEYNSIGQKIAQIDQANIKTLYENNGVGALTAVVDADNHRTEYTYDLQGNKLSQKDANNHTTYWEYDNLGRVTKRTLPLGQYETLEYDTAGNVIQRTDFNGKITTYRYEPLNNRLEETRYADGSSEQFSYDVMGNRTQAIQIDAQGNRRITHWEYDVRDRLVKETQADNTLLEYQYDANGNRTQVKLTQAGKVVVADYAYDELNRLSSVTDASGITRYGYDEVGNRTSISYPNGTSQVYAYDSLNRLTLLGHYNAQKTLTQRYSYTLDASGHRKQIAENNRVSDYTYDNLYRLTQEQITDSVKGDYLASYQYDNVGNRVYSVVNGVGTSYSYDDNDRLTQQGSTSYSYDDNGNTLSKNAPGQFTQYTYNSQDKLVAVQQGADNLSYQYNVNGIRTQKTQNGNTTKYLVDENRDYAQVLVEENPLQRVVYSYGDDLISQNRNGNVAFYHYDGLGSTRRLSNAAGVLTDAYDYEAFGTTLNKVGSTENAYLFTGEQLDGALNQYYLRARYYDQGSGRFTQMDSYQGIRVNPQSLHKYVYAHNNPVFFVDPSGNFITLVGFVDVGLSVYSFGDMRKNDARRVAYGAAKIYKGLRQNFIAPYRNVKRLRDKGEGIFQGAKQASEEVHHLIEKRFFNERPDLFRQIFSHQDDIPSVCLDSNLHQMFTTRWANVLSKSQYNNLIIDDIVIAAEEVYAGYPQYYNAIRLVLGL